MKQNTQTTETKYLDNLMEFWDAEAMLRGITQILDMNFTRRFVLLDIGITARNMNYWYNEGLLPDKSRIDRTTYRFNFTELVWFSIVRELREYGFAIDKIKEVKYYLLSDFDYSEYYFKLTRPDKKRMLKKLKELPIRDEESKNKFIEAMTKVLTGNTALKGPFITNTLNLLIINFILYRERVKLLIDRNGMTLPVAEKDENDPLYETVKEETGFDTESYITLSLHKFFRKFITDPRYFTFSKENKILSETEAYVLTLLREGKAKALTIRFKDEKPYLLEITRETKIQAEARLSEVLLRGGYQDISMKTENGQIVISSIVTKEKL